MTNTFKEGTMHMEWFMDEDLELYTKWIPDDTLDDEHSLVVVEMFTEVPLTEDEQIELERAYYEDRNARYEY